MKHSPDIKFFATAQRLSVATLAALAMTSHAGVNDFGEARGSYVPIPDVSDKRQMTFLWNSYNVKWKDYFAEWSGIPNVLPPAKRTTDVDKCLPGDVNPAWRELVMRQTNIFRATAGLKGALVAGKTENDAAQASALIQQRYWMTTRAPTHTPQPTDACYSALGAQTAAISNVGIGLASGPVDPRGYIDDDGSGGNALVGHRQTFLAPALTRMAVGDVLGRVPNQTALYSGSTMTPIYGADPVAEPVFWPPRNAMLPVEWFPISSNRFSVQCQNCNFAQASVTMTYKGQPVPVTTTVGSNIIVFAPQNVSFNTGNLRGLDTAVRRPVDDEVFTVDLRNASVNGQTRNYQYTVTVYDAYKELATRVYPANYVAGLWNNDGNGEAGWGVYLGHGTTGTLFGTIYTYGEDGQPRWLAMPGCTWTTPTQCVGRLYSTRGTGYAQPFDASKHQVIPEGTLTLSFSGAKSATMTWTRADGSTAASRPLTRFENIPEAYLDGANYGGLWNGDSNPAATYETGWGVSIDQFFSTMVAVWYIYDDSGAPTWVIMSGGTWINATAYEGTLYKATGTSLGRPWVPSDWKISTAGTARFVFHNQDEATFTYTIDGRAVTKSLKRFARF